jgi:hypothetical protein
MRTIGIEFEFGSENFFYRKKRLETLDDAHVFFTPFFSKELNNQNFSFKKTSSKLDWALKTDSCGYEITTPAIPCTYEDICKVSFVMENFMMNVGKHLFNFSDCGLHVHISINDFTKSEIEKLFLIFYVNECLIMSLFNKNRSKSPYLKLLTNEICINDINLKNKGFKQLVTDHDNHYRQLTGINLRIVKNKIDRIEVRYCPGTLSSKTIRCWSEFLCILVELSKNSSKEEILNNSIFDLYVMNKQKEWWFNIQEIGEWVDKRKKYRNSY